MTAAQVQCFGCNRNFTPRGLSQHVSKSRDPRCRASSVTGEVQLATAPIHRTAFPPALAPNWVSQGSGRVSPDDLGGRDDEMDGRDGMQSPGSGRVSPNNLGGRDDETDGHDMQLPDGEFSVACVAVRNSSELDVYSDINAVDPEEDPSGPTELADVTDADAFEVLTERNIHPARTTIPNQHAVNLDTTAEPPNTATEQAIPFDVLNAERLQTVVIDHFPLGNAGAPIPSMARESNEDTAAQSVWALFISQCDWQITHWAKMRGPTSSALTDLLAIGEVRVLLNLI